MIDINSVDLHIHTVISDGTDKPAELLPLLKKAGITVFSITDHDAIEGCLQMRALLQAQGMKKNDKTVGIQVMTLQTAGSVNAGDEQAAYRPLFLSGVEFSCQDELGKYHILGYGYHADGSAIRALVNKAHAIRMEKLKKRLAFLEENFSIRFSEEEKCALMELSNPGKPHLAKLMVHHGYAATIPDAMKRYLNRKKFPNACIRPEEAIDAILADGGIPVLAHPSFGDGNQLITGEEMRDRLRHLCGLGLQGAECFYSGFSDELQEELLSFAEEFDLFVTAGSDYHGENKTVCLGQTYFDPAGLGADRLQYFLQKAADFS